MDKNELLAAMSDSYAKLNDRHHKSLQAGVENVEDAPKEVG